MTHQRLLLLLCCLWAPAAVPHPVSAQRRDTTTARTGAAAQLQRAGMTQAQVIERLRASGMTREQVRAELQRRGYDPSLADPYFDLMERESGAPGGRRRDDLLSALEEIGLADSSGRASRDTTAAGRARTRAGLLAGDTLDQALLESEELGLDSIFGLTGEDRLAEGELPVFGRSFFRRAGGRVDEPAYGPVDASYRVGPGDEVNVVLTGAVQDAYALRVSREGRLVVPEAGEIVANGLTLGALEDIVRARLANVYAGVGTGAGALTRVGVSLGRVRMIEVFVVGDVERPGAYQAGALGTVLSALYRAGGPSKTGSFREIEIRRGTELLRRFDLYDYLLHGNSHADLRLEHGDVIFVPPVSHRVAIDGAVKRPGMYELLANEGLRDALRFAGGPEAEAALRRVQIDRIVPPAERKPGVERVLVDVDVVKLLSPGQPDVALADGDRVRVFAVTDERRNLVTIVGEVRRPGAYAWATGTTLADVLDRASGVTETAYTGRAHIYRLDPATGIRRLVSASLAMDAGGRPAENLTLEDRDSVVVYSRERLRTREYVSIGGRVKRPGRYLLSEGATVNDIILAAGGFAEGAWQLDAYVARPNLGLERADSMARIFRVPLASTTATPNDPLSAEAPAWAPAQGEFRLRHGDRIEVRQAPGYENPRTVVITGEVAMPGGYVLETRQDRLSSLVRAAGGLTSEAHAPGLQVVRKGDVMAVEPARALQHPGSDADVLLQPGDSVHVPRFDPSILVTGAVIYRTRVAYHPGMSLNDAIREAGGYTRSADRAKTTVTYQNGERRAVHARALLPDGKPEPLPGSVIFVPERPAGVREGPNWGTLISQAIGAAGAIATLLIALKNQ